MWISETDGTRKQHSGSEYMTPVPILWEPIFRFCQFEVTEHARKRNNRFYEMHMPDFP